MNPPEREEWVAVAQFMAFDAGLTADLAVSKLQGSGIPVMRVPTGSITGAFGTGMLPSELIRVIVPPEYEDRAREILAEQFENDVLADQ